MNDEMVEGIKAKYLDVLSAAQLDRIHEASLKVLAETRISTDSDIILEIFADAGAVVEGDSKRIRIPPESLWVHNGSKRIDEIARTRIREVLEEHQPQGLSMPAREELDHTLKQAAALEKSESLGEL